MGEEWGREGARSRVVMGVGTNGHRQAQQGRPRRDLHVSKKLG